MADGWGPARACLGSFALLGAAAGLLTIAAPDEARRVPEAMRAPTTATTAPDPAEPPASTLRQVFARASRRLQTAESFTVSGSVRSAGESLARPGKWLAENVTIDAEIAVPDRVHEVAVDAEGRAVETVAAGVVAWSRSAADRDSLPEAAWDIATEFGPFRRASGPGLLPEWLGDATRPQALGFDAEEHETFRATLPGTSLGPTADGGAFTDGEIILAVDAAGEPVHASVMAGPGGVALVLELAISRIGEPVTIPLPDGVPAGVTGSVRPDEMMPAGIANPVELAHVPNGWLLAGTELQADSPRPGCSTLVLEYQDVETPSLAAVENHLSLRVTSPDCAQWDEPFDQPFEAGGYRGTVSVDNVSALGQVSDGEVAIEFFTDLPLADVATLLASAEPFDPFTPPIPVDGIPSSG